MNQVKIYRNGSLTPASYSGEVMNYAVEADKVRPEGRPGRMGSLYASPTLAGVCRWTRAHLMDSNSRKDVETYELTVDADSVYVYDIRAWEGHSWSGKPVAGYWNTGMTLTEWLARGDLDGANWEVLLSPESIMGTPRRVTRKRLLESGGDTMGDLESYLKRNKIR